MPWKSFIRIAVAVLVTFALVSASTPGFGETTKITIKAISAWPKSVYEVQNFMKFLEMVKENVAKNAPGQLEIKYVGGPEVTPNREQVEAVRNGLLDMVFTTYGYYVSAIPAVDAMNLTQLMPWEEREKGVNKLLNKIHNEKVNCYYLGRMGPGIPFTLYLKKPIKKADLSGLKIRCSPTNIPLLKKLGAQPLVIPPPDVFTALERGLADGVIWPAGLITDWGWDKVVKYIVDPSFYMPGNVVLVNLKTWNKLPRNLQQILLDAQEQAEKYAVERARSFVKKQNAAMIKSGSKFDKLPDAEAKKFTNAAYTSLWDVILKKDPENGAKLKKLLSK